MADETHTTGAKMADETSETEPEAAESDPGPVAEDPPTEEKAPQVRVTEPLVQTFTIPDLGGLTIGRQWQEVSADQLTQIRTAARASNIAIEVKEDSQDAE